MQRFASHNPAPARRQPPLLSLSDRRSASASPNRTRSHASYGSMQERRAPSAEAQPKSPVVYPAPTQSPFSTERAPLQSDTRSLRSRNGKAREDEDCPVDSADTAPAADAPVNASRNRSKWGGLVFELENRGSVARDHLAGERTFLAWLRTSLALASIGIAITQLFRLPSTSTVPSTTASATPTPTSSSLSSALASLAQSTDQSLAALVPILEAQQAEIEAAQARIQDSTRYRHLGKPIGGTFIALALVFLYLGIHRFFAVQSALMREPSQFPPSRRSVGFSSFAVGALILATFVAILTTR